MNIACVLCTIFDREEPLSSYDGFSIFRTKDLKGHRDRIMAVQRTHGEDLSVPLSSMISALIREGEWVFADRESFVVLGYETDKASVKDHFHIVCTDFVGDDLDRINMSKVLAARRRN